ncbi:zinc ribbon domain-containing protein [Oceanimonas marisflavi]|uniref:zinc ribbon domain-containing protein n=1 Tax=Oceanimonas marisflavi TaxID=2059724 RepID=UPI000D320989|nr:zinc ribbon domain-containing protein [Oceanimonas marisflavi]
MATIKCTECDNKISDSVKFCPHCGAPNSQDEEHEEHEGRTVGFLLGSGILFLPLIFSWFTLRKGYSAKARFMSFAWIYVTLMITIIPITNKSPTSQAQKIESRKQKENEENLKRTAANLINAYGYSCDFVDHVTPFALSEGFNVFCENSRYHYEIENKGGNWIVRVK